MSLRASGGGSSGAKAESYRDTVPPGEAKSFAIQWTEKQPSANAEHRVEHRKRQQKMRKNSSDGQGHEHKWNEHHPVQYARGDDASAAGEASNK